MRKIRTDEIKETAEIMAESFCDYPLYYVFFKDDEKMKRRIFYFFWYRLLTRKNLCYITDDKSVVVIIKKPEDKEILPVRLILHPKFMIGFIKNIPLSAIKRVLEFMKMEKSFQEKYFHPETDWFVQAVCVLKKSRGSGAFFKAIKEMDEGFPLYCETHTERNVKLYQLCGLELCGKKEWKGITHYAMKRKSLNEGERQSR